MPVRARTGGLDRPGRFERLSLPSSTGGFGESRSAICASLVAHDAFAGSRSARSLRYEYGNSWVVIIARGALCFHVLSQPVVRQQMPQFTAGFPR